MSIMNELLVKIVEANGGTVTTPNNRNQLLQDWLDAVSGESRQYLNFNGMSYGEIAPIIYGADFAIEGCILWPDTGTTRAILGGTDAVDECYFRVNSNNTYAARLNGLAITHTSAFEPNTVVPWKFARVGSSLQLTVSGVMEQVVVTTGTATIMGIGKRFLSFATPAEGYIYDVSASQPDNTGVYPNPPFWPVANGFTLGATTPNVNDPSGDTDMDLFNVLEGDWTTELP